MTRVIFKAKQTAKKLSGFPAFLIYIKRVGLFVLLVSQNKQFKDFPLEIYKVILAIFHYFPTKYNVNIQIFWWFTLNEDNITGVHQPASQITLKHNE